MLQTGTSTSDWMVLTGTPTLCGSRFSDVKPTYMDVGTPATQNSIPGVLPAGYDVELGITMTRTGGQLDLPSSCVKMFTVKIKVNGGTVVPITTLTDLQLCIGNPPTISQCRVGATVLVRLHSLLVKYRLRHLSLPAAAPPGIYAVRIQPEAGKLSSQTLRLVVQR